MNLTNKFLIRLQLVLLGFVGVTAIYGGWSLMADPTGMRIKLPIEKLRFAPFETYFIPGMILFGILGIGNLLLLLVLLRGGKQNRLAVVSGVILCGWIAIQTFMMQEVNWLQLTLLITGVTITLVSMKLFTSTSLK